MRKFLKTEYLRLYLWIGLAYAILGLFVDLSAGEKDFLARVLNNVWRAIFIVAANYLFFEHTLPFVRQRRLLISKVLLFLLASWLQLMLYSFGLYAWRAFGIQIHLYVPLKTFESAMEGVSYGFPFAFFSLLFFGVIRHVYGYNRLRQRAQQLLIEKQEAELSYLKSQTNPHFLFNTLNNIYSLAKDKSDLAPESVLRLSEILRFMLHETGREYIAIDEELKIINDYIALEQLRYDDSLRVTVSHNVEDMKQAVPPLLMIPLVENAFKHGVSETRNDPFVDIHLSVNQRILTFTVKNSAENSPAGQEPQARIGLSNLRRQLELLYRDYDLSVRQSDSVFTATLTINLATHV